MPDTPRTEQLRRKITAMRAGKIPQDEALELAVISHLQLERELAQARQDGIEEGRRQMREEAVQVCRHEAEGWRKQNCDPWANAVGACAISIQAIPVEKEPT